MSRLVLFRDAAATDDAVRDRHAVFLDPLDDGARAEGGGLDQAR
jgi:hypothetical protein